MCHVRAKFVTILLLASCGGDTSATQDASSSSPDATGDTGSLLGSFSVSLVGPVTASDGSITPGHTAILGKVYDGAYPDTVVWTTTMTDGGCSLQTPSTPFCSPSCGSTGVCTATNTCTAYPTSQNVGTVHMRGVGSEFDLTSVQNTYQAPGSVTLAYPAFAAGDAIYIDASGSTFTPAFEAGTRGVSELAIQNATALALQDNAAFTLGWTAEANSKIHVKLDISHHGGSKGKIECDADDSGSLTISAAMVHGLLQLGAAGYPTIIVTRSATGHVAVASGHVDLIASSQVEEPIAVPGVTSCTDDTQCTAPQTCQDDLTCK